MFRKKNVSSEKGVFDISKKEITIPLAEYVDLISKEMLVYQIRHIVEKNDSGYGTVPTIKAILQIDEPESE